MFNSLAAVPGVDTIQMKVEVFCHQQLGLSKTAGCDSYKSVVNNWQNQINARCHNKQDAFITKISRYATS